MLYRKLIRVAEPDLAARLAERTMLMAYLGGELPGSLNHALRDARPLAAGRPFIGLDRVGAQTYVLSIGADCAPEVTPDAVLAAVAAWVDALPANPIAAETLLRLQTRFAASRANADKDPRLVYNRLINWLARRNRYEDYQLWPVRIAAAKPDGVSFIMAAIGGPGRIVTGIMEPGNKDGAP